VKLTPAALELAREQFSTQPAADEEAIPDVEGGGKLTYRIDRIPDKKGGYVKVKVGDRVQFYVEVFSKADPDGAPGRSAVREKEVVSEDQLTQWLFNKDDLKERTRQLEEQQKKVKVDE
jgi:hypothetical protein